MLKEFGMSPKRLKAKGTEVQSDDVSVIAARAALETYSSRRFPLFTEDTGLWVTSLGGFPGPYASFAYRTIGVAGLLELARSSKDRSAEFRSAVAYCAGRGVNVFEGRLKGRLALEARGRNGFGFDPVFIAEGDDRTLAELSVREKCEVSHRARALRALADWLTSRRRR